MADVYTGAVEDSRWRGGGWHSCAAEAGVAYAPEAGIAYAPGGGIAYAPADGICYAGVGQVGIAAVYTSARRRWPRGGGWHSRRRGGGWHSRAAGDYYARYADIGKLSSQLNARASATMAI